MAVAGCAEFNESTRGVSYSSSAKDNYEHGLDQLKRENWLEAIKLFQYTRSKFGFSKWATLAELGMADAHYGQEHFSEAVEGYRGFIKNHPTHEKVQNGYCAFRIGEAYYKQIPTDWFLSPPSYEKDQGPVQDALRELQGFVTEYGDSPHLGQARKLLDDCAHRLADHELYVAEFYLKRGKPLATIGRLDGVRKRYPGTTVEAEVLLLLGRTYLAMEKPGEARKTFEQLVADHPKDYRAQKAKRYLQFIERRYGTNPHG